MDGRRENFTSTFRLHKNAPSSDPGDPRSARSRGVEKESETRDGNWYREVVQRCEGLRFHHAGWGREDVFCHHTAIQSEGFRTLAEGQKVEFDVARGPKGLQAQNVKPI